MLNNIQTGYSITQRIASYQLILIVIIALAFLVKGVFWSCAVILGGGAVLLANLAAARIALAGGVSSIERVFLKWLLAMVVKFFVFVVPLLLGFVVWKLPAIGIVIGVISAVVAQFLAIARR